MGEVTPRVTVQTLTYNRVKLLSRLVSQFLAQDYKGKKELILFNDDPMVKLTGEFKDVQIINWPHRFWHLSDKRNKGLEFANGDIFMGWSDDDLYEPWTLTTIVEALGDSPVTWIKPWLKIHKARDKPTIVRTMINGLFVCRLQWLMKDMGGWPFREGGHASQFLVREAKKRRCYTEAKIPDDKIFFTWICFVGRYNAWKNKTMAECKEDPSRIPKEYRIVI